MVLLFMSDFDQILPITDVKRDLLSLVKRIHDLRSSIAITRKGKPAAVLMSVDEYEGLLETIEILSDKKLMRIIRKSKKELDAGKFISHREVWGS